MLKLLAAILALAAFSQSSQPTLATVLQRAGAYAVAYENKFSLLVAEERYEQSQVRQVSVGGGAGGSLSLAPGGENRTEQKRVLVSDYLLVRLNGGGGWMPFRDVFEADGRTLREREERMLNLFLKPSDKSLEQARRIMADSTRFNLGSVQRTINIPTLAVLLVQPELASRFAFDREADEVIDSAPVWVIAYRETSRPSLIRTTNGADLPMRGSLWVDPQTGTIMKTAMAVSDARVRASTLVAFTRDPQMDFWVPSRMDESYSAGPTETITCVATYSRYRRFEVATDEQIRTPGRP